MSGLEKIKYSVRREIPKHIRNTKSAHRKPIPAENEALLSEDKRRLRPANVLKNQCFVIEFLLLGVLR